MCEDLKCSLIQRGYSSFEGASDCSSCLETVEYQLLSEARLEALEALQTEPRLRTH